MSLQKIEDDKSKYFYDLENNLEDGNTLLCRQFGYNPNLVLLNSSVIPIEDMLDYVKLQTRSIKYRVQNKTTYNGYYINFRMVGIPGEVYVAFYDGKKIIRSLDWSSIFQFISVADFSKPFTHLTANKTLSFNILNRLDDGHIMDGIPPLFLDSAVSSRPTNHIFCEFVLDRVLENQFLIDDRYLRYLEDGSLYSRSAKHYVHNGVQLNIPIFASPAFDFLIPEEAYSIDSLQLKAATAYQYARRYNTSGLAKLDTGRELDEDVTYTMDGSDNVIFPISTDDFTYISVGGGSFTLPNTTYANILTNPNRILFYYTFNDDANSLQFKDYSNNEYYLISESLQNFEQTSFGKTINFSGVPLYRENINLSGSSYTISFWYDPNMNSSNQCLFDFGFIKLIYNNLLGRLQLYFESNQYNISIDDSQHYINLELNNDDDTLYLFIDTNLITSIPITAMYAGLRNLYVGTDSTKSSSTAFYGLIAEFNMVIGTLSQVQKDYVYENSIQLITKLNKFYNRTLLSTFEKAESSDSLFLAATSYNESFLINDEFLFNYSSAADRFAGLLSNNNIIPKTIGVMVRHFDGSEYVISTFMDNGAGIFESIGTTIDEDYLISGTVNYDTGAYLINMYSSKNVRNAQISPFQSITSLTASLKPKNEPLSLKVFYTIDTVQHTAVDDGLGHILGFDVDETTSFIDYATGDIFIQFSQPTTENTDVRINYSYRIEPIIDEDETIFVFYNTKNQLDITEVALEDANKNVLVYATFPAIRFNNRYNYINTAFLIRKT